MACRILLPIAAAIIVTLLYYPHPVKSLPVIPTDSNRLQLFKDALSWMTFTRNGKLVDDSQVEKEFLGWLLQKYTYSHFYRTFIIAFQHGVLPKLTLQENEACDPSHVWKYKSPLNQMVYWHGMKKLTFESYQKRKNPRIQYCDYRQGLVCNPTKSRCECPEGSTMSPISPGSSVKRCLLQKGEACALPDFDHGCGPECYKAHVLIRLLFNLEKPLGCQIGSQCRMTNLGGTVLRCYGSDTDPSEWFPPTGKYWDPVLDIGQACSMNFAAVQGDCDGKPIGTAPGYICYNFGPPRSTPNKEWTREGFCAHELGPWQIRKMWAYDKDSHYKLWTYNFIQGFVHRRSVPLNQTELEEYYIRYVENIQPKIFEEYFHQYVFQEATVGQPCSVAKTEKMKDIWKFYAGLEEAPPPGKDFVTYATKQNLTDKMKELETLVDENLDKGRFCKVYWSFVRDDYGDSPSPSPALECVKGSPVGIHDGTCQVSKDDSTKAFAEKVQQLGDFAWEAGKEEREEENDVDKQIMNNNPDPECTPFQENGYCATGYYCFYYFADGQDEDIYDDECKLITPFKGIRKVCRKVGDRDDEHDKLRKCEGELLNKLILEEVDNPDGKLKLGDKCDYQFEKEIKEGVTAQGKFGGNKYVMLNRLMKERLKGNGVICDRTKLQTCKKEGFCKCWPDTGTRKVEVFGKVYESDYCYYKKGYCNGIIEKVEQNERTTEGQKERIWEHYGKPNERCYEGNACVFVDFEVKNCTEENTGRTGHDIGRGNTGTGSNTEKPFVGISPPNRYYSSFGGRALGSKLGIGWALMVCLKMRIL